VFLCVKNEDFSNFSSTHSDPANGSSVPCNSFLLKGQARESDFKLQEREEKDY